MDELGALTFMSTTILDHPPLTDRQRGPQWEVKIYSFSTHIILIQCDLSFQFNLPWLTCSSRWLKDKPTASFSKSWGGGASVTSALDTTMNTLQRRWVGGCYQEWENSTIYTQMGADVCHQVSCSCMPPCIPFCVLLYEGRVQFACGLQNSFFFFITGNT